VSSVKSLYNGNIAETYYRTGADNVLRKYGYEYDNLNRLKNAIYQKPGGNTYPTYEDYSEKNISYDKNGNIQTLYRNGDLANALPANQIDNLQYYYKANSNILLSVFDNSGNTSGFKDSSTWGDDYSYDANGNMITDKNKNITAIVYNHLNLPTKITFGSTGSITYIYNANGQKVEKYLHTSSQGYIPVISYYCGAFQYIFRENYADYVTKLQFITTSEGYVKHTAGVYSYVFNYTDHLGNVRLSYGLNANVLTIFEESNYYPFGLKHKGYNSNNLQPSYKYRFQGQERQDELGLNWDSFKWRNYDMAIGRFMSIDPLAEDYTYNSPYAFAENKLGMGRELEGCELGPFVNFALANTPPMLSVTEVVKVSAEIGAKTSEVAGKATEATAKLAENASKGRSAEIEQLGKNGLEKNTKSFRATDPKTGKEGVTIPDAVKPGGGTVEIKNVGKQSLTEQLRLQKAISEGNGLKPELIINQGAKMSKPLQNAGFDIKTYGTTGTVIESTGVPKPNMSRVPIKPFIEMGPILPGIF
jgi:RHS repeat-associated protein